MPIYEASLTIRQKTYNIAITSFGEGIIPIFIVGHAEVYAPLLKKAFAEGNLLKKYCFFVPLLYWCQNNSLANLPLDILQQLTLEDLSSHINEIRHILTKKGLLAVTAGKIGIYSHSFFSALAFQYAKDFPEHILFIEAEGPPPYNTKEWSEKKAIYFEGNASLQRKEALAKVGVNSGDSAVDEKCLQDFASFIEAYHKMNPALWYDFESDHRQKVWGTVKLNMDMMKHYFNLLSNYDSRDIIGEVICPVHFSLGLYDAPVPSYLWIDPPEKCGIGFFQHNPKRDYYLFSESGHWPFTEQSAQCCQAFDRFIDGVVALQPENTAIRSIL